ncbi:MAG: hypothetical protein KBD24_02070 [Candidatus Pacebacteria bacterium]|nr:hypothetical protein [Candidatus Paceibacterota bacterium]
MEKRIIPTNIKTPPVRRNLGPLKKKIILLLLAGFALAFARSAKQQYRIYGALGKEWREINRRSMCRAIAELEAENMITRKHTRECATVHLTKSGKNAAEGCYLNSVRLVCAKTWDGIWRVVVYDIPEDSRDFRIDLGHTLKHLGCFELQQSVLVYPYDCEKEIRHIIDVYHAHKYIRYMEVLRISGEEQLLKHFQIRRHSTQKIKGTT